MSVAKFREVMLSEHVGRYLLELGLTRKDLMYPMDLADLDSNGFIDQDEFRSVFIDQLLPLSREKALASLVQLKDDGLEQASAGAALAAQQLLEGQQMAHVLHILGGVDRLASGATIETQTIREALESAGVGYIDPEDLGDLITSLPARPLDWASLVSNLKAAASRGSWFS